jgi:hypothetical protein
MFTNTQLRLHRIVAKPAVLFRSETRTLLGGERLGVQQIKFLGPDHWWDFKKKII